MMPTNKQKVDREFRFTLCQTENRLYHILIALAIVMHILQGHLLSLLKHEKLMQSISFLIDVTYQLHSLNY